MEQSESRIRKGTVIIKLKAKYAKPSEQFNRKIVETGKINTIIHIYIITYFLDLGMYRRYNSGFYMRVRCPPPNII